MLSLRPLKPGSIVVANKAKNGTKHRFITPAI
jgi:hypothetical protein